MRPRQLTPLSQEPTDECSTRAVRANQYGIFDDVCAQVDALQVARLKTNISPCLPDILAQPFFLTMTASNSMALALTEFGSSFDAVALSQACAC